MKNFKSFTQQQLISIMLGALMGGIVGGPIFFIIGGSVGWFAS
jgi:hypothetical protein